MTERLENRLREGDPSAVAEVRELVRWQLSRYRSRMGGALEDLEQDVLLDLLDGLDGGSFRGESTFETYVRSIARFKCIDWLRARGRRQFVELDDAEAEPPGTPRQDALQLLEQTDLAAKVVAALPEGCRELWAMLHAGRTYEEMAEEMGIRPGTLRVRVHRCRQAILDTREKIEREL